MTYLLTYSYAKNVNKPTNRYINVCPWPSCQAVELRFDGLHYRPVFYRGKKLRISFQILQKRLTYFEWHKMINFLVYILDSIHWKLSRPTSTTTTKSFHNKLCDNKKTDDYRLIDDIKLYKHKNNITNSFSRNK